MKLLAKGAALGAIFLLIFAAWVLYPAAGVPILAYHKVSETDEVYSVPPAEFEEQMRYLAEHGYTAVSLTELAGHMTAGRPLPEKPVVITFDDGYANNYHDALPIMARHGMKATVFIVSDYMGQQPYLTWDEVRALAAAGTEIGSHTLGHRPLTDLPPAERLRDVTASKEGIEWRLKKPVYFLAYPFGQFDDETIAILRQAGFKGACGGRIGLNKPGDNLYALKRISVSRSQWGLIDFRLRLIRANVYSKLGL
jgi:peptidoglycan/xylan/chitin deacetylase (PgdA/CDA1 family)